MTGRALRTGTLAAALAVILGPSAASAAEPSAEFSPAVITVSKAGDALGAPIMLRSSQPAAAAVIPSAAAVAGRPLASMSLTSRFGMRMHPILGGARMHSGVDLAAPMGSPVYATAAGVVSYANWRGGYGLLVVIDSGGQLQTRFGHLSRLLVAPGQSVARGQILGLVGSTGRSTGPHLHYEVRRGGQAIDPLAAH